MKGTKSRGGYVLTDMHVEPSLRAKRSHKSSSKKSEYSSPYRKPTQVGEERILRCARELSLRNSAK